MQPPDGRHFTILPWVGEWALGSYRDFAFLEPHLRPRPGCHVCFVAKCRQRCSCGLQRGDSRQAPRLPLHQCWKFCDAAGGGTPLTPQVTTVGRWNPLVPSRNPLSLSRPPHRVGKASPRYRPKTYVRSVRTSASFRQACMNCFEACGIVGCRFTILWRTAHEFQTGKRSALEGRAAAVRAVAKSAEGPCANPRFVVGFGGEAGPRVRDQPYCQGTASRLLFAEETAWAGTGCRPGFHRGALRTTLKRVPGLPFLSWLLPRRLVRATVRWSWKTRSGRRCGSI